MYCINIFNVSDNHCGRRQSGQDGIVIPFFTYVTKCRFDDTIISFIEINFGYMIAYCVNDISIFFWGSSTITIVN